MQNTFAGSSPGGIGCLAVVTGPIGALCCVTNMVITIFLLITMSVTQHMAPMGPMTTVRHPIPQGEDPPKDTWLFHMFWAWGECSKYGIQTHFKGKRALKQILVKLKDKDPKEKKSGVIYCY